MFSRFINYIKEARIELLKVTWPTRQETAKYTLAVIFVSLAVALFLGGFDFVFAFFLNRFIL